MPKRDADQLGEWMAKVDAKLDDLAKSRLSNAALDGTTLWIKDEDGTLRSRLGRQADGSYGNVVIRVQPPPQLTAPILTVGEQAGTCVVKWDGLTFDGRPMPQVHGHTEIWAEHVGDDWSPTVAPGDDATRVGTIRDRKGGEQLVALPQQGEWAVWLRAMGADRETAGPWSPVSTVEITPLVDTEEIQRELDEARERLEEAEAVAAAAIEQVNQLVQEWEGADFPQLQQDLEDAKQAVADAQERLDGTESDITDAQQRIADLRDTVLPGIEQTLSDAIQQAQQDLKEFRDEWDESWDPDAMKDLRDRQDALEGDLITGLDDVYGRAEQKAQELADDAVNRAAADAQSEYDRLQELAERALSRAGDNVLEDPSFETNYWFDLFEDPVTRTYTPTTVHRSGAQAMRISDGPNYWMNFDTIDVEEDESWRLSVWYRTEGSISMGNTVLAIYDQVGGNQLALSDPFTASDGEFRRAVVTFTVPPGVTTLTPRFIPRSSGGEIILDDIAFQEVGAAAEALRLAEVARQQAEAAHIAAGNAVDVAANAYDAASSKSTIHWSLSAPSGTGNPDDVWWRYENSGNRRIVTGQWFWDGGVWRAADLAEEYLPLVNIGTGTYGDLHGDRLAANTVRAGALAVMPDAEDFAPGPGGYEDLWTVGSNNAIASAASDPSGYQLRVSPGGAPGPATRTHGPWIRAQGGDRIRYKMFIGVTGSPDADLRVYFMYDGSVGSWAQVHLGGGGWIEGVHEVRSDVESTVALSFVTSGGTQGHYWIRQMEVRKQVKGVLIEDGAIKAHHGDFADITASQAFLDHAMVNLIQGRMANFDEAIIGNTLLRDGAITASKLSIVPDTEDFAPDPSEFPELWDLTGATLISNTAADNPSGLRFSFGRGTGQTMIKGPIRPVVQGQQIFFRGRHGFNNGATTASVSVRMEWRAEPLPGDSNRIGWNSFVNIPAGTGGEVFEGSVTVPEGAAYANLYFYQANTSGGNAAINGTIHCQPKVGAVLIEDGSITAEKIVAESVAGAVARFITLEAENVIATLMQASNAEFMEVVARVATLIDLNADRITSGLINAERINVVDLFANTGFINTLRSAVVEALSVTAERGFIGGALLEDNTITVNKLYALDEIMSELGRFLKIEAGALESNEIIGMIVRAALIQGSTFMAEDNDGNTTVRLDGMDNLLRGRLEAGVDEDVGITLDYGDVVVTSGWTDEEMPPEVIRTSTTPFIEFKTDFNHLITPKIYVDEETGGLAITPGREVGTPSGSGQVRIWGHTHVNRLITSRIDIPTTSGLQPGGIRRDGARTRLLGRTPESSGATDMFSTTRIGPYTVTNYYRATIGWAAPPAQGVRRPVASVSIAPAGMDSGHHGSVTTGSHSGGNFRMQLIPSSNHGWNMWVDIIAHWE